MKLYKKILALGLTASMLGLTACSSGAAETTAAAESTEASAETSAEAASDDTVYKIGICQLVQHPALDLATQGFKDAVTEALGEDHVEFD